MWTSEPFKTEERDGRIYGRGAADNKGPQIVHMSALAQVLKQIPDYQIHITYLIEGEEEIGSPSFRGFLEEHKKSCRVIYFWSQILEVESRVTWLPLGCEVLVR